MRDGAGIERVAGSLGSLDVLVNNAGENYPFDPSEWDADVFERSVTVNLVSAFRMSVACKPLLARSALPGGASVLSLASMSAFRALTFVPGYGAAKAGIVQMTKNLAVAWVAERIRVNAVAPGLVESGKTAAMRVSRLPGLVRADGRADAADRRDARHAPGAHPRGDRAAGASISPPTCSNGSADPSAGATTTSPSTRGRTTATSGGCSRRSPGCGVRGAGC
jgi:NAD(P)-dependent dehydrogenase (short-subunit alcohol dehydrogenase family)